MTGVKHLIECHCVLALYKNDKNMINHKFPVYSKIDSRGSVVEKIVKCNNCDALHIVKDFCRSEIMAGKDQSQVVITKEEIGYMLSDKMNNLLLKIDADISIWEHVLDIIEEERWGEYVVIKRDIIEEKQQVKILKIVSEERFKISNEMIQDIVLE